MNIVSEPRQLTLEYEPGLLDRYSCLRDAVAAGVYSRGLKRVAADLDMAPGNLSVALGDDGVRHFSIESLERYIQTQGDLTPVYYLIARYLGDQAKAEAETMRRVESLLSEVAALVGQAPAKKSARR